MLFRYDFNKEKLDISNFTKQANYYIGSMTEVTYNIYIYDFKIKANISMQDKSYLIKIDVLEIVRDSDNEITLSNNINIIKDVRFKSIKFIQDNFPNYYFETEYSTNNKNSIINLLSDLIKILFKINKLKAFA